MNIIKISVMIRSSGFIWSYKEKRSTSFWDDLGRSISDALAPVKPVEKSFGNSRHFFYVATDEETQRYKSLADDAVSALLPEEEERGCVIVSVTEAGAEEIRTLSESDTDRSENAQFWEAAGLLAQGTESEEKGEIEAVPAKKLLVEPVTQIPSADGGADDGDKSEDKPAEHLSLSGQARKIKELKDGLLSKVKGQRHAVDELVQSIFECEMFAAFNPDRKGPLATFLFTGPSGVGKTMLATRCGKLLGRETLVVDMSEYSDNLANSKFNGDHGQPAVVTSFVRQHPNGIIIFDEVEKAHINTIHLFLQILDEARLMDHKVEREVSFKDTIIIMTTNAGKALYDDATVCDLSQTPRSVILDALRTDINPQTREPFFPECITTRMANGHVILFNHLEPFSLMEIVRDELSLQMSLFEKSSGVKAEYDPVILSALMLYNGGGASDARTLCGLARTNIIRELQEIVMQIYAKDPEKVDSLKNITLTVNTSGDPAVEGLFNGRDKMQVAVFAEESYKSSFGDNHNTVFDLIGDTDLFKRRIRGVTDYVLIDPAFGLNPTERVPNDIEDLDSAGMRMFHYIREYCPEIPVYILDTAEGETRSFDTLLARGAKGIVKLTGADDPELARSLETLSKGALVNNAVYSLGRSGKFVSFNCAQYIIDESCAVVSFEKLQLKSAPRAGDSGQIAKKDENGSVKFKDVVGCKSAKETLREYCAALDDPRKNALSGKRMPKGVLLYGPPGTGKTMLAKAMANECNATFFPVSATSFFGSLVGETERNIRDLFKKARKYAPSVIFVDEVDAIGRRRTGSVSSVHNEDALNCFLAEMDGFFSDEKRPVFILAATNYELEGEGGRVLDSAFVRRFDSKLHIPLPDTDDRYELLCLILKKHGINFGEDHEQILCNMAERTGGMNNADLNMLCAQYVRVMGDGEPDRNKFMDTLDEFRFGEVNKMDPDHLRQTACHEAGHAMVSRLCGNTPSFLTVVSRGGYGGYMENASRETGSYTFDELMNTVCCCLAGRIAEVELYGDSAGINTGAVSDIKKARYFVRASLKQYAMGDRLFPRMGNGESEKLIREQYARTQEMIRSHRDSLERLTDLLTEKKSLDKKQMEDFFAAENI